MEDVPSRTRQTDCATFKVGQRVSFIDPQSGIYTDGVVICFHGDEQVEVGYHRSGWSDPKYNRIVSIFTLLTIAAKPLRRFGKNNTTQNEDKAQSSNKSERGGTPTQMENLKSGDESQATADSDDGSDDSGRPVATATAATITKEGEGDMTAESACDMNESCREEGGSLVQNGDSPRSLSQAPSPITTSSSAKEEPSSSPTPIEAVAESRPDEPLAVNKTPAAPSPVNDDDVQNEKEGGHTCSKPTTTLDSAIRPLTISTVSSNMQKEQHQQTDSPTACSPMHIDTATAADGNNIAAATNPSPPPSSASPPRPPSSSPVFSAKVPSPRPPSFTSTYPGSREDFVEAFKNNNSHQINNKAIGTTNSNRVAETAKGSSTTTTSLERAEMRGDSSSSSLPQPSHRSLPMGCMDSWEAARVMVELRESFLRMTSSMPTVGYGVGFGDPRAGLGWPQAMPPIMPMMHQLQGPYQPPHYPQHQPPMMPMMGAPWQPMGMGMGMGMAPPSPANTVPFKKRKWQI